MWKRRRCGGIGEALVIVDRVMGLNEINEAMDHVRAGKARGRVVIRVRDD